MFFDRRILVTVDTNPLKIGDCISILNSIQKNVVRPDVIYINALESDFPNRLEQFPQELKEYLLKTPSVKVNWISRKSNKYLGMKGIRVREFTNTDDIILHVNSKISRNYIGRLVSIYLCQYSYGEKHDVVILYSKNGVHSDAQMYGDKLEIEYVIASLKKFCSSWLNRIILVGDKCDVDEDIIQIKVKDIYNTTKAANIWNKIRTAIMSVPDLSDDFMFVSDDQVVVKPTTWDDIVPTYSRIIPINKLKLSEDTYIEQNLKPNVLDIEWEKTWHRISYTTFQKFVGNDSAVCQMQPHIWMKFNKFNFLQLCELYDYVNDIGCLIGTTYYNTYQPPFVQPTKHHVYIGTNRTKQHILSINQNYLDKYDIRWLCWTDNAFQYPEFRNTLDEIIK